MIARLRRIPETPLQASLAPVHAPDACLAPPFTPRLTAWAVSLAVASAPVASTLLAPRVANAQSTQRNYDIPAGPLSGALARFAAEAGILLSADARLTAGKSTAGLRGRFGVQEGLNALLEGSGLNAKTGASGYVLEVRPPTDAESMLPEVSVIDTAATFFDLPAEPGGFTAKYQESATKMPLAIRETPQSISVITRQSMDDRLVRDANTSLELASGVTSGRSGQGGPFAGRGLSQGENFNLRGQDLNENRDIRMDGFTIPSSAFDMAAFERVEAVKGPSSVLYGQGSIGGFVNLVRKKPQAERAATVVGQVGSFGTYRGVVDATGALDAEQRVLGLLTVAYDDSDSFTGGVETRIALIAPSVELRIGDRTRVLLQVLYQDDEYIPSQGFPLRVRGRTASAPNIPRSLFVGVPSTEKSTAQNLYASARIDHELSDNWLASLYLQGGSQVSRRFFDNYGYDFSGLATPYITMAADRAQIENDNWAGELRLDGRFNAFGREHLALMGLEVNQRNNRTAFGYATLGTANLYGGDFASVGSVPGGAASLPFNVDFGLVSANQAVYGQVILSLTERMKLLVGARYDWVEQERKDNFTGLVTDQKDDETPSMRFGLTYDFSSNVTAYATFGESFNPVDAIARSGAILDPETGRGFESGMKTAWLNNRLDATLAVFQQDLDNQPIPDPLDPNFSISGGLQRTKGVEVEVSGSPYPGLTLGASATWLDSKYIDPLDPNVGLNPYGSVDRLASLFAVYELQRESLQGLGLGATVAGVGQRSASFAGSGAFYGTGTDELFIPGYTRVDLNFYYSALPDWRLSLQMRNVTNKIYVERFRDVSGSNYFGAPVALLFSAQYKFK